jgi:hypothetical protein
LNKLTLGASSMTMQAFDKISNNLIICEKLSQNYSPYFNGTAMKRDPRGISSVH